MRRWLPLLLSYIAWGHAAAHLNSPHVFLEQRAGPYSIILVVHMPPAIPGEAEVQVRIQDRLPGEEIEIQVRAVPPQGEDRAPPWFPAQASDVDPDFYTTPLPLMLTGVWRAQVRITGARGEAIVEVPVPARVAAPRAIGPGLMWILVGLVALQFTTGWSIFGGLGRDAHRDEHRPATRAEARRGRIFAISSVTVLAGILLFIGYYWVLIHTRHRGISIPALAARVSAARPPMAPGRPPTFEMSVSRREGEPVDDVVADHGKMMHLVMVNLPDATHFVHSHPTMESGGIFRFGFAAVETGTYRLFGKLLLSSGEVTTVTTEVDVPGAGSVPDSGWSDDPDDSESSQPAFGDLPLDGTVYDVGDDLSIRWISPFQRTLRAGDFYRLSFQLTDGDGQPVGGLDPYAGEAGQLVLLRSDAKVFAHVYPMGTIGGRTTTPSNGDTSSVTFPYGFPEPGLYRLWVQIKHRGRVYTGVFDVPVT